MSAPLPQHWARVRVVQGSSEAMLWDLGSNLPEARVIVGSGAGAQWIVNAPSVAPQHFELYWDGSSVWLSPPKEGSLRVDGEIINSWRQVVGTQRIDFGQGAMVIESSHSAVAPQASLAAIHDAPDTVPPPPPPGAAPLIDDGIPMLDPDAFEDEKTNFLADDLLPDAGPMAGEATRMLDSGLDMSVESSAPRPIINNAALGVSASMPMENAFSQPLKTQVLALPPEQVAQMAERHSVPGQVPILGETDVMPRPSNQGGFQLPPSEVAKKEPMKLPPPRTLALFGVTLVVAIGVMTWTSHNRSVREAAHARVQWQQHQNENAARFAEAHRLRIESEASRNEDRYRVAIEEHADAIALARANARTAAEAEADPEMGPAERAAQVSLAERRAVERLAVNAVVANRFGEALACYQALSESFSDPAYATMTRLLRERLACRRGVRQDGSACE